MLYKPTRESFQSQIKQSTYVSISYVSMYCKIVSILHSVDKHLMLGK